MLVVFVGFGLWVIATNFPVVMGCWQSIATSRNTSVDALAFQARRHKPIAFLLLLYYNATAVFA